jgi:sentrin-specific protease 7
VIEVGLTFGVAFLQPCDVTEFIEIGECQRKPLVSYPSKHANVVVNVHDVDMLRFTPGVFLNDNIVDFGLKYLFEEGRLRRRVEGNAAWLEHTSGFHYFSQFFYNRLSDCMRVGRFHTKAIAPDDHLQQSQWEQLRRWSRKVEVMQRDYLVIPINKDEHWSVAIVCNPSSMKHAQCVATKNGKNDEAAASTPVTQKSSEIKWDDVAQNKKPCIIFLDSAKYHNSPAIFKNIRKYLQFTWDDTLGKEFGSRVFDASTIPGFSPKVPQQINNCDCGVYLLHFVELFIDAPPVITDEFIHQKGSSLACPSGSDEWFPLSDIRKKRREIRDILMCLASKQRVVDGE